jgi:predicted ATPase
MKQIVIQNFKAIRNINAVPIQIRKMTIFVGEQASRKSTVAQLLYFFKTLRGEVVQE